MNKIYSWLAQMLLAKIFPGSKTLLVAWATTIIGAINIFSSTDLWAQVCDTFHWCPQGSAAWGTAMMVLGEIIKLLRFATGQANGETKFLPNN